MYVEKLYTPHPERAKGLPPVRLEDCLQLDALRQELDNFADTPEYEQRVVQAAESITHVVHRTLSFRPRERDNKLLTPDNLADGQTSDCYGYTVLLSECFERANIRHYVAFVNGHALTIVAPSKSSSELWVFDALSPKFNGPLKNAVEKDAPRKIEEGIQTYGRGAVRFYSYTFAKQSKYKKSFIELIEKNPWLYSSKYSQIAKDINEYTIKKRGQDVLFMSVFEPQVGRNALEAHKAMYLALREGKRAEAYRAFKRLHGFYPELDIRNAPEDITWLVRELGMVGCVGIAKRVVDESMENFAISKDPRFKIWQADLYRRLGNMRQVPELLKDAIAIYEETIDIAKHPGIIEAKARKARQQLARLATQQAVATT